MKQHRIRKHDRIRFLRQVTYRVMPDGRAVPGDTIDISCSGLLLHVGQLLHVDDVIEVTWSDREPPAKVSGVVVYVNVQVEGNNVGLRFLQPLSQDALQALLIPPGQGGQKRRPH